MFEFVKQWHNCIFNGRSMFLVDICQNSKHNWVGNVSQRSGHQDNTSCNAFKESS